MWRGTAKTGGLNKFIGASLDFSDQPSFCFRLTIQHHCIGFTVIQKWRPKAGEPFVSDVVMVFGIRFIVISVLLLIQRSCHQIFAVGHFGIAIGR